MLNITKDMPKYKREYARKWRVLHNTPENREKNRKWNNEHKKKNRDKINLQAKEYRLRNKEKIKERNRLYSLDNKDKIQIARRKYYIKNREKCLAKNKKWSKEHPQEMRIFKKANLCKRRGLGYITTKLIQLVYEDNIKKFGTLTCVLCYKPILFGDDSLEHLLPITRSGTNDYNNLGIAHLKCNLRKHNKTMKEWEEYVTY